MLILIFHLPRKPVLGLDFIEETLRLPVGLIYSLAISFILLGPSFDCCNKHPNSGSNKIKMCSPTYNGLDNTCWAVATLQPRHRLPQPNCSANFNCSFYLLIQQGFSSFSHPLCIQLEGIGKRMLLPSEGII